MGDFKRDFSFVILLGNSGRHMESAWYGTIFSIPPSMRVLYVPASPAQIHEIFLLFFVVA
jgi:hypothetical protein